MVSGPADQCFVEPTSPAIEGGEVCSSADALGRFECGGDLTTSRVANVTNELKFDEELRRVQEPYPVQVTADSGEDSGLDKGHLEPELDPPRADLTANLRVGVSGDSAAGMENLEGATPGGCCLPSVTHPP